MGAAEELDDYDVVWRALAGREGESLHDAAARVLEENWRGIKRKVARVISNAASEHPHGSWNAVHQAAALARQKRTP